MATGTEPAICLSEEVAVISDELLAALSADQAPKSAKDYKDQSGYNDRTVLSLRIDFQSMFAHMFVD